MSFDLQGYRSSLRKARIYRNRILSAMAIGLAFLWWIGGSSPLPPERERLWVKVREAQSQILSWRRSIGSSFSPSDDPWGYGLIGLEWSPLSTTLGSLPSKRTACDPAWALAALDWFDRLELEPGDPVAIFSSSSFPGMMLNVLMAAEDLGLDISLVVSLGSSTWGANDPLSPWPAMAGYLRSKGFLHTKAMVYTKGGGGEVGGGLSPEGTAVMESSALAAKVPLLDLDSLEEVVRWKMDLIGRIKPKAVISIGGSSSSMGDDPVALSLPPGPLYPGSFDGGDGVIGLALREGYPVVHLLNLKDLALKEGIPFDSPPVMGHKKSPLFSVIGLCFFSLMLFLVRRFDHMG